MSDYEHTTPKKTMKAGVACVKCHELLNMIFCILFANWQGFLCDLTLQPWLYLLAIGNKNEAVPYATQSLLPDKPKNNLGIFKALIETILQCKVFFAMHSMS